MSGGLSILQKEYNMEILRRDPCFGKIDANAVDRAFDAAWKIGSEEGGRFVAECKGNFDICERLQEYGVSITTEDADCVIGNMRYYCEFISKKKAIVVYRKSVELWAEENAVSYLDALNVILAHEYFHYLEETKLGWVSKKCEVPMLVFGRWKLGKTGVAALSEIAANAFASECYKAYIFGV